MAIVLHVQMVLHVQIVLCIVRVVLAPDLALPTVTELHVQAVLAGRAESCRMRIELHVHTWSHVQTPRARLDVISA